MVVGHGKVKGEVVPVHTVKAFGGSRGIAPLILNMNARRGKLVSFKS
jgi:hypothetical protein